MSLRLHSVASLNLKKNFHSYCGLVCLFLLVFLASLADSVKMSFSLLNLYPGAMPLTALKMLYKCVL